MKPQQAGPCQCCGCTDPPEGFDRREFLAAAATGLALTPSADLAQGDEPPRPPRRTQTRPLQVQPVFNCEIYPRRLATSWRVTGAIQTEEELREEEQRIQRDLSAMAAAADFPLKVQPLLTVRTVGEAAAVPKRDYDVSIIYAARRNLPVLEALASPQRWNLMFVRHRSGPLYYMYIGSHTHFLRQRRDHFAQPGMTLRDIVVDDHGEILWRLRALYALKNTLGTRIVAVGGPGGWGADGNEAPGRAQKFWKFDIRTVSYEDLGVRIQKATRNPNLVQHCRQLAEAYLRGPGVSLETTRPFVDRAFLLCEIFRDLLGEAEADALTINNCMTTIMPVAQTTACLPLTLLNDNGFLAFCESDFVAIPAGVLLHHVSNRPVFLCNPSLPHKGVLTVSHCTAPRRMDGKNLEPVRVLTHYESDFGAATKVEMRKGQGLTIVDPDFAGRRWLGFGADILDTPFFPICRTQLDVRLRCDGQKLAEEIRGFHWLVAYGNHLRELGYAVRKAGINWLEVT
jgi:hypothetical protein